MLPEHRARLTRSGLTAGLVLILAALLAPTDLIGSRGALLRGLVGSYAYSHAHQFEGSGFSDPALNAPAGTPSGTVIAVSVSWPHDQDNCANRHDTCSFGNSVEDAVSVTSFSDHGAGGAFGYLNGTTGAFTPTNDPSLVTHYQAPQVSEETWVEITATVDDAANAVDPETQRPVALGDDPAASATQLVQVYTTGPEYITLESPEEGTNWSSNEPVPHSGHWVGQVGSTYWQEVWTLAPGASDWNLQMTTQAATNETPSSESQSWSVPGLASPPAGSYRSSTYLLREDPNGWVTAAAMGEAPLWRSSDP